MAMRGAPDHEIILATSGEERQQCLDIRIAVFHTEQGFPVETEIDDKEDVSTHFLLRLKPSLVPVGTIRGYTSSPGIYKLSRFAVLKSHRQLHFGRALVLALHDWVRASARILIPPNSAALLSQTPLTVKIVAHSQIYAIDYYARFGYVPKGEQFDEDGAPHQAMELSLPLDP